ncbi:MULTISPECIES: TonB-dependent receptor domain-containing protein [Olivibacter]|uniref:TonB-dependent receptor domain-containing protein n=1 Tax=Olivibacter jilunii TaxID=985016 RepID=A0ABW6ATE0_9SPHI|nr:TonB-dependent receptor [Pseudosphingobacterium sp.]
MNIPNTHKKHYKPMPLLRISVLTLFFFYSFIICVLAQEKANIQGTVKDQTGAPVDLATIILLRAADSSYIRSVFSDQKGNYQIPAVDEGKYILSASMIGFRKTYLPIAIRSGQKTIQAASFVLMPETNALKEVTVTASTPSIERKDGALVVNVANTALAAGNSAMDILERSPGVSVDKDGNISLMGRQGVTVMIDGKQTYLSAEQLANMLKSMDGNNVQSIELNTNPSAKYDAAGTAGIINIKLKKNNMEGTNGTLSLSGGYGRTHKSNNSLQINHKTGKVNLFGNYSYVNSNFNNTLELYRIVGQSASAKVFDQFADFQNERASSSIRGGIDYKTSERNTLSGLFSGFFLQGNDHSTSNNRISDLNAPLDSTLTTLNRGRNKYNNLSFNVNNTFNIDTNGRKLVAEVDVSRFSDKTSNYYDNYFYRSNGENLRSPEFILNDMPSIINIQTAKIDYTHPLNSKSKIELGMKYSSVKSDNNMGFYNQINGDWQNNENRSNHFIYKERVSAAYAIYNQTINKTEIKAGLRAEHTYSDGNSITMNARNKRNYLSLFPNISLNQQLSDKQSIGLSYSRRINRPNYGNLNPFLFYVDPYSYQQGNPFLNPSYTNSYELSYTLLKKYTLTAGYQKTKDMVGEMMYQDDETNIVYVTNENIASENVYFANLNIPLELGKVWSSNTNINAMHLGYKADIPAAPIDFGQFAVQANSNHTFNVTQSLRFEATLQYRSPLRWSIYQIGTSWGLDLGVNKSFWNKKAQVKFAVTDIFNTRPNTVKTDYSNLNVRVFNTWESRVARLTFTFNFGNQKLKISERNLDSSEKNRVGK